MRIYRVHLRMYRAVLWIYTIYGNTQIHRAHLQINGALFDHTPDNRIRGKVCRSPIYRDLLRMYRALLRIYRAVLRIYRALLRMYRALLDETPGNGIRGKVCRSPIY